MKQNGLSMDSILAYWFLLFGGILFVVYEGGDCLRINDLKVPNVVENGSESAVVLDCDYSLDNTDAGLVVKWFLDDNVSPVYQWIPPKQPQDLGKLKGKLNLGYRASDEKYKMYRALQIMNPSPELSGEYKCSVSTYQEEYSLSKKMVVFVPQSNLLFWHSIGLDDREDNNVEQDSAKEIESIVNVTCMAENVFPEPILRIFSASKPVTDKGHVKTRKKNDGLYDVSASIQVDDDDMDTQEHVFECELSIPEANYTVKKALLVSLENSMGACWFAPIWLIVVTSIFTVTISIRL